MELECETINKSKTVVVLTPAKIMYQDKMPYLVLAASGVNIDQILEPNVAIITSLIWAPQKDIFFVAPFRGYCFQISNNFEMRRDMGSSTVIGFGNLFNMQTSPAPSASRSSAYSTNCGTSDEMIYAILKAFLMEAFKRFEITTYGTGYIIDFGEYGHKLYIEYIDAVYDYIKNNL